MNKIVLPTGVTGCVTNHMTACVIYRHTSKSDPRKLPLDGRGQLLD